MHCSEFLGVLKQSPADGFLNDLYYLNLKQGPVHSKTFVPISFFFGGMRGETLPQRTYLIKYRDVIGDIIHYFTLMSSKLTLFA